MTVFRLGLHIMLPVDHLCPDFLFLQDSPPGITSLKALSSNAVVLKEQRVRTPAQEFVEKHCDSAFHSYGTWFHLILSLDSAPMLLVLRPPDFSARVGATMRP